MKLNGFHGWISFDTLPRLRPKVSLCEQFVVRQKNTGYPSRPLRNDRDSLTMIPSHKEGRHQVQKKLNIKGRLKTTPKSHQGAKICLTTYHKVVILGLPEYANSSIFLTLPRFRDER
jgi:hypothetical protein